MSRSIVALATVSVACAGRGSPGGSLTDASVDAVDAAVAQPRQRFIHVTLPAVSDWGDSEEGYAVDALPLEDVRVCVHKLRSLEQRRPRGSAWATFRDWSDEFPDRELPCVTTGGDGRAPSIEVPSGFEIVLTGTKPGYQPAVFTMMTGALDLVATVGTWRLRRSGAPFAGLPGGADPDPSLGMAWFATYGAENYLGFGTRIVTVSGVRVTVEPMVGTGPLYEAGGVYEPDRPATFAGRDRPFVDFSPRAHARGGAVFDLPEGEYRLRFDHPEATCEVVGLPNDQLWFGFPTAEQNVIAVPVLEGHVTPGIGAWCPCNEAITSGVTPHPESCDPGDAGSFD